MGKFTHARESTISVTMDDPLFSPLEVDLFQIIEWEMGNLFLRGGSRGEREGKRSTSQQEEEMLFLFQFLSPPKIFFGP